MYRHKIPLVKLSNFRKRKIHIIHHHMANIVYACILSHLCWKSPEWVCFRVGGDGMFEPDTQPCGEQWWDVWARYYIILDHFQQYAKLCNNWEHLPSMENGVVIGRKNLGSHVVGSWWKRALQEKRRDFEGVAEIISKGYCLAKRDSVRESSSFYCWVSSVMTNLNGSWAYSCKACSRKGIWYPRIGLWKGAFSS